MAIFQQRLIAGAQALARFVVKLPVHLYRATVKGLFGFNCRHLPTCSAYALEAIDRNGAWRGGWLMVSRLSRCRPWGTSGYDPVPDIRGLRHPLAPWRYGRWSGRHLLIGGGQRESAARDGDARGSPPT